MKKVILACIRFYQKTASPDHGVIFIGGNVGCRFYPSCSQYTYEAIKRFGVTRGLFKSLLRILKCNPFFKGGVDLV